MTYISESEPLAFENMAKMGTTCSTCDFGPDSVRIRKPGNSTVDFVVEGRPSAS